MTSRRSAELLAGRRIVFEAPRISVRAMADPRRAGVEPCRRGLVEALRAVKDEAEIAAMRRASALSDEIFAALAEERFTGAPRRSSRGGSSGASVSRGPRSVVRRHRRRRRERRVAARASRATRRSSGVLVTVDAGCVIDGYCSDCTRTFAVGEVSERAAELYALCLEAQLAGLAAVAPGVHGRDADAASRTAIEAAGLGWAYGHGMGHGVGLQIHEAPTLRPESTDVLEAGNVVSVEPGIYLPDDGGVPDRGSRPRDRRRLRAADAVHEGAAHRRIER